MPAIEIPGFSFTLPSNADWSSSNGQFRFCTVNSSGKAIYPSAGGAAVGVRNNKPQADEATTIVNSGIVFVEAGESLTIGTEVETDATGRAVALDTGESLGIVLKGAGGAGELAAVLLKTQGSATGTVTQNSVLSFGPFSLARTSGDMLTGYTPGFNGTIRSVSAVVTTATSDADAAGSINLEIGTTNLTGGVITVGDTADGADAATPVGKVLDGTAVTGGNVFSDTDTISIEWTQTTAFSDGAVLVLVNVTA